MHVSEVASVGQCACLPTVISGSNIPFINDINILASHTYYWWWFRGYDFCVVGFHEVPQNVQVLVFQLKIHSPKSTGLQVRPGMPLVFHFCILL